MVLDRNRLRSTGVLDNHTLTRRVSRGRPLQRRADRTGKGSRQRSLRHSACAANWDIVHGLGWRARREVEVHTGTRRKTCDSGRKYSIRWGNKRALARDCLGHNQRAGRSTAFDGAVHLYAQAGRSRRVAAVDPAIADPEIERVHAGDETAGDNECLERHEIVWASYDAGAGAVEEDFGLVVGRPLAGDDGSAQIAIGQIEGRAVNIESHWAVAQRIDIGSKPLRVRVVG